MRVLHVVRTNDFAGVERYVAYVAPRLVAKGCDVSVVGGDPATMRAMLYGKGVEILPARTWIEAARHTLTHRNVDVVHAHMTSAEWAVVPTRPFTRAAYVTTRHFAAVRGRPGVVRTLSRVIPRVFDRQLAISAFVASKIGEQALVLANGVPVRDGAADDTTREPAVVVVQRLEAEKQTGLALDAWSASAARGRGWRLLIAGSGTDEPALRARATALGLDATVDFLGHVDDVPALLDRAGVLLATAPAEPFGLSVVEAMASGVPVVAAAGGAHLETVGGCSGEYLFGVGDAAACAERLDALVADAGARAAYGKALQAHQRDQFDVDTHVDRLLAIYADVVALRALSLRASRRTVPPGRG